MRIGIPIIAAAEHGRIITSLGPAQQLIHTATICVTHPKRHPAEINIPGIRIMTHESIVFEYDLASIRRPLSHPPGSPDYDRFHHAVHSIDTQITHDVAVIRIIAVIDDELVSLR